MRYGKNGGYNLYFFYDDNDQPLGFYYTDSTTTGNGIKYYFVLNAQGDVVQLRNLANEAVANYRYDAWGKLLSITDPNGNAITNKNSIAYQNPIRYRGYVYDDETGFYYLNTRYYDPSLRRFINADSQLNTSLGILGNNMFAYCNNNPLLLTDSDGNFPFLAITAAVGAAVGAVVGGVKAAKSGKSIWKGALKGAAIGGLVGLGVGAAAGALLAGSVVAPTAAVVSGASMLSTAVSVGGLGAGISLVVDNISRAINNVGTVLYSGGEQARQAATTFANDTGGTTIDSTVIGQVADAATKIPGSDFRDVWSQASATFCDQASGIVNAFVSNSAYRGEDSIFWSVEMPALLNNPRVTEIIIHIFE